MLGFCHENRGAISVFLMLILLPVVLLGGLTTDAARIYMSKVVISDAGEMSMNAGLAQYDGKLHDEYGLLVMEKSPEAMEAELKKYFEKSLNGTGLSDGEDYKRILDLVAKQFDAINLEGSQIYKTEVEKQQIIEYMKYRAPICLTELVLEKLGQLKDTKKKTEAMEAQLDFAEAMEDCNDSLEDAKKALDNLNNLISQYPSKEGMQTELDRANGEYTIRVSRCVLMVAAIGHYTEEDSRGDAEAGANSVIEAAKEVKIDDTSDSQESFESYMSYLYYEAGVQSAGGLQKVLDEHEAEKPEENSEGYQAWKDRMDELNNLKSDYDSAKEAVTGYPNQLRKLAKDTIDYHTAALHRYLELSKQGEELSRIAYSKLETVKEKLDEAGKKWEKWSEKANVLKEEGIAGDMTESVEDYEKFFAEGDPANDKKNLELLMEDVSTDKLYFGEMREILPGESFWEKSLAKTSAGDQYGTYMGHANAAASSSLGEFKQIEDIRTQTFLSQYDHITISTTHQKKEIANAPFYQRLKEYFENAEKEESKEEKEKTNKQLEESKEAGEEAEKQDDFPTYTWVMDSNMPSVALGLVAEEGAGEGLTSLGGNVNGSSGRRDAISKYKNSLKQVASFLDGLDRIIADNLENLYVAEYAMQMFSYYTVDKEDGEPLPEDEIIGLSGYKLSEHKAYRAEVEYILWGNKYSAVNIANTMMMLFGIRLLFNSFFAFTNHKIVESARFSAQLLAGPAPYLAPVFQVIIELALAGIETASDMKKLKDGFGVTVIKAEDSWSTVLYDGDNTKGMTLDYSEYLRLFLNLNMLTGKEVQKLARIGDCIRVNTEADLINGYTMLAIEAKVGVRTTFMRKISQMGAGEWTEDSYTVLYQSILGY